MSNERTAPKRVRITRLQEAQLAKLAEVERACAAQYHEVGFDAAEVPPRNVAELTALPRDHNVHVAEADHEPVGYAAWRDEEPGVGYVAELSVHPELQRFGIGARLVEAMREDARAAGIGHLVVRRWSKAPWAVRFYESVGFKPVDESAPPKVQRWKELRVATGKPFVRPGEAALWAEVGAPPSPAEDETEDATPEGDGG